MKALEIYEQAYNKYIKERSTDEDWTVKAMHEYARLQIEKDRERVINEVVKWQEHDCDSCACSCRGDLVINSNDDIRSLPINLD